MVDPALVIRFTVEGAPVQWSRAAGKNGARYNLPEHKAYKRTVGLAAWAAGARAGKCVPAGEPLMLFARVVLPIPERLDPAALEAAIAGMLRPTGKPDLDNWVKLPMDAMNGLVWTDDCQVVEFAPGTGKWYGLKPRLDIAVWRL